MKSAVFALFVAAAVLAVAYADLTDEQRQRIQEYGKVCVSETGVDTNLIDQARQGTFTNDEKLKAFTFCMSKRLNFQTESGDIQADAVRQKLATALNDPEAANQLVEKCLVTKDTSEDSAFESFRCYYENTPNHLIVF